MLRSPTHIILMYYIENLDQSKYRVSKELNFSNIPNLQKLKN